MGLKHGLQKLQWGILVASYLLFVAINACSGDSRSFGVLGRHFPSAQFGSDRSDVAQLRKLSLAV